MAQEQKEISVFSLWPLTLHLVLQIKCLFFLPFKMSVNVTNSVLETVFQDKMTEVWWLMLPSDAEYYSCLQQSCIYPLKTTQHWACTCTQHAGIAEYVPANIPESRLQRVKTELSISDYDYFLLLTRFSRIKEGTGSNPIFCGRAMCTESGQGLQWEIPPPSCIDYLHCSSGISSHTDCKTGVAAGLNCSQTRPLSRFLAVKQKMWQSLACEASLSNRQL